LNFTIYMILGSLNIVNAHVMKKKKEIKMKMFAELLRKYPPSALLYPMSQIDALINLVSDPRAKHFLFCIV